MRISFLGDVMCEPLLIKKARKNDGSYDFSDVFCKTASLFDGADYVVANLETPVAGEDEGLSKSLFSFNAPVEFLDALKGMGVSCATVANNHALDRGIKGAVETLRSIDEADLEYVGISRGEQAPGPLYKDIEGESVALISYTYGVNPLPDECDLSSQSDIRVNLLRPQGDRQNPSGATGKRSLAKRILLRATTKEQRIAIKKKLGMKYYSAYRDDVFDEGIVAPYAGRLIADIEAAKSEADTVICCLHIGGQFNAEPGKFSDYVVEAALKAGCDAVIASHPHVVQRANIEEGKPVFYSLGNFNMSPNSVYILHEHHPEYGLVAHLDIEKGSVTAASFSIVKMIEEDGRMTVWPIADLYQTLDDAPSRETLETEVQDIHYRVTGVRLEDNIIRSEYALQEQHCKE